MQKSKTFSDSAAKELSLATKRHFLFWMNRDQKITKLAGAPSTKDNGVVTESKVAKVLAGFQQVQHRPAPAVLSFLNYLRREVALQTAVSFSNAPTGLSDDALRSKCNFQSFTNRPVNTVLNQTLFDSWRTCARGRRCL